MAVNGSVLISWENQLISSIKKGSFEVYLANLGREMTNEQLVTIIKQVIKNINNQLFFQLLDFLIELKSRDEVINLLFQAGVYKAAACYLLPEAVTYLFIKNLVPDSELDLLRGQAPNIRYAIRNFTKSANITVSNKVTNFLNQKCSSDVYKDFSEISHSNYTRQSTGRLFLGYAVLWPFLILAHTLLAAAVLALLLPTLGASIIGTMFVYGLRLKAPSQKKSQLKFIENYLVSQCNKHRAISPLQQVIGQLTDPSKEPKTAVQTFEGNDANCLAFKTPRFFGSTAARYVKYNSLLAQVRHEQSVDAPAAQYTLQLIKGKMVRTQMKLVSILKTIKEIYMSSHSELQKKKESDFKCKQQDISSIVTEYLEGELTLTRCNNCIVALSREINHLDQWLWSQDRVQAKVGNVATKHLYELLENFTKQYSRLRQLQGIVGSVTSPMPSQERVSRIRHRSVG